MRRINIIGIKLLFFTLFFSIFIYVKEKKVGGNATNGYHTEVAYYVGYLKGEDYEYSQVSRYFWYADYIFTYFHIILLVLSAFYIEFVVIKYLGPKWVNLGKLR